MADQKSDWVIVPDDFPGYSMNLFNIPTHYKKTIENGKFLVRIYVYVCVVFIHIRLGPPLQCCIICLVHSFDPGGFGG